MDNGWVQRGSREKRTALMSGGPLGLAVPAVPVMLDQDACSATNRSAALSQGPGARTSRSSSCGNLGNE